MDMQKVEAKKKIGGGLAPAPRPPMPGGGQGHQGANLPGGRPPSGGQKLPQE